MTKISPQVSFKLGKLASIVDARAPGKPDNASRSQAIRTVLARYEAICRRDLPALSPSEWRFCADALSDVRLQDLSDFDGTRLHLVWADIENAIQRKKLDGVVGAAIVTKVRSMTTGQLVALVDRIERETNTP